MPIFKSDEICPYKLALFILGIAIVALLSANYMAEIGGLLGVIILFVYSLVLLRFLADTFGDFIYRLVQAGPPKERFNELDKQTISIEDLKQKLRYFPHA